MSQEEQWFAKQRPLTMSEINAISDPEEKAVQMMIYQFHQKR